MEQKTGPKKEQDPRLVRELFIARVIEPMLHVNVPVGPMIWRVVYINPGQSRVSMEPLCFVLPEKKGILFTPNMPEEVANKTLSHKDGMAYLRANYPQPHEEGRNPKNVTLGVQSAKNTPKSTFKGGPEQKSEDTNGV